MEYQIQWLQIQGCGVKSQRSHITSMEVYHEFISMVLVHLLLFQEGQLSVTSESMSTSTG